MPFRRRLVGEQTFTVYASTFTRTNGRVVRTLVWPPITWRANVDPVTGWRVMSLPEGERDERNLYILSSDLELQASNQEAGTVGHVLVYRGEQYEIRDVMPFEGKVLDHTEYRARRLSSPVALPVPPAP
jgi:hypothetical protein